MDRPTFLAPNFARLTVRGHGGDPLVLVWVDKVTIGAGVFEKAALRLAVLVTAPAVIRIVQAR
jgi:hypothetical protein